jgi:fumarylacetoacetate (FAA) hydrolase
MKLTTFQKKDGSQRLGLFVDDKHADLQNESKKIGINLPDNMLEFLQGGEDFVNLGRMVESSLKNNGFEGEEIERLLAPIPNPTSCRDAYAFRQHVASARRNRGVEMIPEFDQYPIFYFTNHNAVYGEGDISVESDHLHKLDFELEVAVVIGKRGKNIKSKDADEYIAGFTIMNDLSARLLQMEEMKLNLGPAKGKDFATTIGPWLVTPDELAEFKIETEFGNQYNLTMKAFHGDKQVSLGNTKEMTWTFAEIIERCSYGTEVYPGDVIGSGTVGTGCYMELNGTWAREAKERGEEFTPVWIEDGDAIRLEIDGLGSLTNTMKLNKENNSILAVKKAT